MLKEFGGGLELTENWAWSFLKFISLTKRKGTTRKVEPFKKFLKDEKFTFQKKIFKWNVGSWYTVSACS